MSKKKPTNRPAATELFPDDAMNIVSGTECTGMVPTAPLEDGEADAYRLIGDMPVTTEKYLFDQGQKRP